MHLTQEKFDQIVQALVDNLDAKHAHVQTITSGGTPVPFHIGYSVAADALEVALQTHGVTVIDDDVPGAKLEDAVALLRRIKSDLMHTRRFSTDDLNTYRNACTSTEGDVEEWLIGHGFMKSVG